MSSGVAIYEAVDDGRDFAFVYFNQAAERIEGVSKEDLMGKSIVEAFPGVKDSGLFEVFQQVWKTGTPKYFPTSLHEDEKLVDWRENYVYKLPSGEIVAVCDDVTEQMMAAESLQQRTFELSERVKELNCLYGISSLAGGKDLSLEELLRRTIELVPPTWQYPEITCARIVLEDREFSTENFKETDWKQTSDIVVYGDQIGCPQVGYLEEMPEADEGPFLKEERNLINAIAECLGRSTERIQAEKALRESEAKYRTLTENLNVGIYRNIIGPRGEFIEANPAIVKMFGYASREEFLATHAVDLYQNPEDRRNFTEKMRRDGYVKNEELPLRQKDRTPFIASISAVAAKDENGEVLYYDGIVEDITERKRILEELISSEERLRILFERAPDAIYINDLKGNFIDGNKMAEEITGYSKEELIGKNMLKLRLLPKSQLPRAARALSMNVLGKSTGPDEFTLNRKDGSKVDVEISTYPVKIENQTVVLGIARDITERKQLEEERRRLEEQIQEARRMESLGVLAGGIAHDFNNLLTGVLGNADLALMKLSPVSPAYDSVEKIIISARRAADLVSQMLAYAGKGKTIVKQINLSEVVEEMAHILDASIPDNAVVEYDLASDLPNIEADPLQIRQVIRNLFNNGSEALGEEGGTITVTTGAVECGPGLDCIPEPRFGAELREGSYVYLQVDDDGCGMDEEIQEKLFDPFFSTKFVGRGLGLPAALGIMRDHGGAISVMSQPGQGTTARILFPVGALDTSP